MISPDYVLCYIPRSPNYGNSQLKMEIWKFTSEEAAAPLMPLAAPLWFWKFWKKILDFGIFSEILNFLKILKIMSYNFQSRKQILTLRGGYELKITTGRFIAAV